MEEFQCRDCYTFVSWQTAKSGKKYLAQRKDWFGSEYSAQRTYWPAHRCTPVPERQAEYAAEQAAKAAAREARLAAKAEREARSQALMEAGVTVPTGRTTVTGVVVSIKAEETFYTYSGEVTLKMLVESDEGYRVWGTVPRSLEGGSEYRDGQYVAVRGVDEGDTVTFTATLQPSDNDPLFGFFKRPTKARILAAATSQ